MVMERRESTTTSPAEVTPTEEEVLRTSGVEEIDPRLIQMLVSLPEGAVIVPLQMKREDVHKVKAVKLSDNEAVRVSKFQMYLHDRSYLPDNTFASLFCYLFNVAYTMHKHLAEEEARKEAVKP